MKDTIMDTVKDRFRLETALLRLERQQSENEAALRQAKFDARTAWEKLTLYQGGFGKLIDRLTGKMEEKEAALSAAHRKAEATLAAAQRERETLNSRLTGVRAQLEVLPTLDVLREQAEKDSEKEFYRLDALYTMELLQPMLEESRSALLELRSYLRGDNIGKLYTYSEQAEIQTAPEITAKQCAPHIERLVSALNALEIPFPEATYFENPTVFLSVAAMHNRRDRVNDALGQAEKLLKQINEIQTILEV